MTEANLKDLVPDYDIFLLDCDGVLVSNLMIIVLSILDKMKLEKLLKQSRNSKLWAKKCSSLRITTLQQEKE